MSVACCRGDEFTRVRISVLDTLLGPTLFP